MKKFIKIFIASLLIFAMVLPVSAEISLSEYVFKGLSDNADDQTIYTYTFGRFTGDPEEVGVKILGNKDYKLSDEALATAKANGGLFGIGLADTNNVLAGSTYKVIPYAITDGEREEGAGKEIDKNMEETVVDVPLQVTNITLTDYGTDATFTTPDSNKIVFSTKLSANTLKEPVYDIDSSGNAVATVFGLDMFTADTSRVYTDIYAFYTSVPEEMKGAYIIETKRNFCDVSDNFKVKFTLNKTATFYFNNSTNAAVAVNSSQKLTEQIFYNTNYPSAYNDAINKEYDPATITTAGKNIWKYECVVPEGETKTFEFNLRTISSTGPMLFIKE